jgi:hypothetical protein
MDISHLLTTSQPLRLIPYVVTSRDIPQTTKTIANMVPRKAEVGNLLLSENAITKTFPNRFNTNNTTVAIMYNVVGI